MELGSKITGIGTVARGPEGNAGLVLHLHPVGGGPFYSGICLEGKRVGHHWQASRPEWIGTLDDWVKLRYAEILEP